MATASNEQLRFGISYANLASDNNLSKPDGRYPITFSGPIVMSNALISKTTKRGEEAMSE